MTNKEQEQAVNFAHAMSRRVRTRVGRLDLAVMFDPITKVCNGAEHVHFLLYEKNREVIGNVVVSLPAVSAANRTVVNAIHVSSRDSLLAKIVRSTLGQPDPEAGEYEELTEAGEAAAFDAADYMLSHVNPVNDIPPHNGMFILGGFIGSPN